MKRLLLCLLVGWACLGLNVPTSVSQQSTETSIEKYRRRERERLYYTASKGLNREGLSTFMYSVKAARFCASKGHDGLAVELYDRAYSMHPYGRLVLEDYKNGKVYVDIAWARNLAGTLNAMGWLAATSPCGEARDGELAEWSAKFAMKLHPKGKAYYLDTLAAAYAEMGEFEKAIETQKSALDYLVENHSAQKEFELRLAVYESEQAETEANDITWPTIEDSTGRFVTEGRLTRHEGTNVWILKRQRPRSEVVVSVTRLAKEYKEVLFPALEKNFKMPFEEGINHFTANLPFDDFAVDAEAATREVPRSEKVQKRNLFSSFTGD